MQTLSTVRIEPAAELVRKIEDNPQGYPEVRIELRSGMPKALTDRLFYLIKESKHLKKVEIYSKVSWGNPEDGQATDKRIGELYYKNSPNLGMDTVDKTLDRILDALITNTSIRKFTLCDMESILSRSPEVVQTLLEVLHHNKTITSMHHTAFSVPTERFMDVATALENSGTVKDLRIEMHPSYARSGVGMTSNIAVMIKQNTHLEQLVLDKTHWEAPVLKEFLEAMWNHPTLRFLDLDKITSSAPGLVDVLYEGVANLIRHNGRLEMIAFRDGMHSIHTPTVTANHQLLVLQAMLESTHLNMCNVSFDGIKPFGDNDHVNRWLAEQLGFRSGEGVWTIKRVIDEIHSMYGHTDSSFTMDEESTAD
jgi:hypothetical protein